jgi:hypothetical protein
MAYVPCNVWDEWGGDWEHVRGGPIYHQQGVIQNCCQILLSSIE